MKAIILAMIFLTAGQQPDCKAPIKWDNVHLRYNYGHYIVTQGVMMFVSGRGFVPNIQGQPKATMYDDSCTAKAEVNQWIDAQAKK